MSGRLDRPVAPRTHLCEALSYASMALLEGAVLGVHIVAGFLALAAGGGALLTEKGGHRHRLLGRTYVYAMAVVSGTALGLLAIDWTRSRVLLGLVAVFSFYFAFSGYRVLSRKRPVDEPGRVDWAATVLLGATGVALLGMGGWFLADGIDFGTVAVVFGGIALVFTGNDVRQFRATDVDPRAWFFAHLQRMGGAYIATVTAFVTVNVTFLPAVVVWLTPTVVGTVGIWYVSRKYSAKFDRGSSPQAAD